MATITKTEMTLSNGRTVKISYSNELSQESEKLRKAADEVGRVARETAFAHGLPITVGKAGNIVKIYPDGHEEIVGPMEQS